MCRLYYDARGEATTDVTRSRQRLEVPLATFLHGHAHSVCTGAWHGSWGSTRCNNFALKPGHYKGVCVWEGAQYDKVFAELTLRSSLAGVSLSFSYSQSSLVVSQRHL